MSGSLRVAYVVEGPTDFIILKNIVGKILNRNDIESIPLQPEESDSLGTLRGGWPGVYRWCRDAVDQALGIFSNNYMFKNIDLIIIHIDADVAETKYSNGHINNPVSGADLPCKKKCPPPSATTNSLREVVLRWLGEVSNPSKLVLCIPSKAIEAWILAGLYPEDSNVNKGNIECMSNIEDVVRRKLKKNATDSDTTKKTDIYKNLTPKLADNWHEVKKHCTEAVRFEQDVQNAMRSPMTGEVCC